MKKKCIDIWKDGQIDIYKKKKPQRSADKAIDKTNNMQRLELVSRSG